MTWNWDYGVWIIIIATLATASMVNRYQWRKAWEAYYKRPLPDGKDHKTPGSKEEKPNEENQD